MKLKQLKASVGRELGMRRAKYPQWTRANRMSQEQADHEIACMDALYRLMGEMERAAQDVAQVPALEALKRAGIDVTD